MMTRKSDAEIDLELDAFFDAAKADEIMPSAAFLSAVTSDAMVQTTERNHNDHRTSQSNGLMINILRGIGGWPAVAALAICACVGIFMGYSTPETVSYFGSVQAVDSTYDEDSFSIALDIETLFQEG